MTAYTDDQLLSAAGFTGAQGAQQIASAQRQADVNKGQIALQGEGEREKINTGFEDRGFFNSGARQTAIAREQGTEASDVALVDLGLTDVTDKAHLGAMQEVARQQLEAEELAQRRQVFDADMALKRAQLDRYAQGLTVGLTPVDLAGARAAASTPTTEDEARRNWGP